MKIFDCFKPSHPPIEHAQQNHYSSASPSGINAPRNSNPDMEQRLQAWVAGGTIGERRAEAAQRILAAYQNRAVVLNLIGLSLKTLPTDIGNLSNLQRLHINCNQLQDLPPEIGDLSNLQGLYLDNNQLQALPPDIGQLSNLQKLELVCNKLEHLPPEIGQLSNLQELYLWSNKLEHLPPEIGKLSNLKTLSLFSNQLQALPRQIGDLSNLQKLLFQGNQLHTLPPEIVKLNNLQELYLHKNQLQALPREIGQLSSLQTLDLSCNKLQALPPEIGKLSNLQTLNLLKNPITTLPASMAKLSQLKTLTWYSSSKLNTITHLPTALRAFQQKFAIQLGHAELRDDVPQQNMPTPQPNTSQPSTSQPTASAANPLVFDVSNMQHVLPRSLAATHDGRVADVARVMQLALVNMKAVLQVRLALCNPTAPAAADIDVDQLNQQLKQQLNKYMLANPSHTNPLNVRAELADEPSQWAKGDYLFTAQFHNLNYAVQKYSNWVYQGRASLNMGGVQVLQEEGTLLKSNGERYAGTFANHGLGRQALAEGLFITPNGYRFEGTFAHDADHNMVVLTQGSKTYPDGTVDTGCFTDVKANHDGNPYERAQLNGSDNQRTLPCGTQLKGYFEPRPGVMRSVLCTGEMLHATNGQLNGKRDQGVFEFHPALGRIVLKDGESYDNRHPQGTGGEWVRKGQREYVASLKGMVLMNGTAVDPDGTRRTGQRAYVPQLKQVCLVEGKIEHPDGRVQVGTWAWQDGEMRFTPKIVVPQRVLQNLQFQLNNVQALHRDIFSAARCWQHSALIQAKDSLPEPNENMLKNELEVVKHAQSQQALADAMVAYTKVLQSHLRKLALNVHPDKGYRDETSHALLLRVTNMLETLHETQTRDNARSWTTGVVWPNVQGV